MVIYRVLNCSIKHSGTHHGPSVRGTENLQDIRERNPTMSNALPHRYGVRTRTVDTLAPEAGIYTPPCRVSLRRILRLLISFDELDAVGCVGVTLWCGLMRTPAAVGCWNHTEIEKTAVPQKALGALAHSWVALLPARSVGSLALLGLPGHAEQDILRIVPAQRPRPRLALSVRQAIRGLNRMRDTPPCRLFSL